MGDACASLPTEADLAIAGTGPAPSAAWLDEESRTDDAECNSRNALTLSFPSPEYIHPFEMPTGVIALVHDLQIIELVV